MIRNSTKAVIIKGDSVLMNKCMHADGKPYYDLPGGGQHEFETMEDSLRREVLEETGYSLRDIRFAALCEEIYTDAYLREKYPDYVHRILHIFVAYVDEAAQRKDAYELDMYSQGPVWVKISDIDDLDETAPKLLRPMLKTLITSDVPMFLGTEINDTRIE